MTSLPDDEPLPHRQWRKDFLYVIELAADRIKVGVTYSPERRLAEHRSLAEAFGANCGPHWLSHPGVGTTENEDRLIDFCAERATQRFRREYFAGLVFEEVVEHAEFLNGSHALRRGRISYPRPGTEPKDPIAVFDHLSWARTTASVEEAARWLSVSEERVHELMESGDLKVMPGPRIPVTWLRRWLTAQQP